MDLKSSRCEISALYDLHSAVLELHLNRRAGFPRPDRLQLLPARGPERLTGHPHENSFGKHVSPVIHLDWRGLGVFSLDSCAAASCSSGAGDGGQDSPVPCPPQGYGATEKQVVLNLNLKLKFGSLWKRVGAAAAAAVSPPRAFQLVQMSLSTGGSEQSEFQQTLIHILLFKVRPLLAGLT